MITPATAAIEPAMVKMSIQFARARRRGHGSRGGEASPQEVADSAVRLRRHPVQVERLAD
jgi:hypothetical protein